MFHVTPSRSLGPRHYTSSFICLQILSLEFKDDIVATTLKSGSHIRQRELQFREPGACLRSQKVRSHGQGEGSVSLPCHSSTAHEPLLSLPFPPGPPFLLSSPPHSSNNGFFSLPFRPPNFSFLSSQAGSPGPAAYTKEHVSHTHLHKTMLQ